MPDIIPLTLTAEVRVLTVGTGRVTLSMFRQLDSVSVFNIQPFGRVRSGTLHAIDPCLPKYKEPAWLELIGRDADGDLVKAVVRSRSGVPGMETPPRYATDEVKARYERWRQRWDELKPEMLALPLIVLAR